MNRVRRAGFLLDRGEQVAALLGGHRVAEFAQRRHRAGDRRQRRAQVVRQRGEQGRAQLLVLLQRDGAHGGLDQDRAVDRDRRLFENEVERVFERRRNRGDGVGRLEAADADDAARRHQRAELETHVRQGAGLPARRLALLERPARRAGFARVERVDGRPGGAEDEIAVLGQQHRDAARVERLLRIDGRRLQNVVERDGAGKLARKFEQRARRLGAFARQALLVARAAGEPAHENGDDQEDDEREKFMRLADAEFV